MVQQISIIASKILLRVGMVVGAYTRVHNTKMKGVGRVWGFTKKGEKEREGEKKHTKIYKVCIVTLTRIWRNRSGGFHAPALQTAAVTLDRMAR